MHCTLFSIYSSFFFIHHEEHPLIHISFSHPVKICPVGVLSEDENLVNLEDRGNFESSVIGISFFHKLFV